MGNTFGQLYRITTFGESHGKAVGVVIDGCPAGAKISMEIIQDDLNRRRPGVGPYVSARQEKDRVVCLSGLENNTTLGTPLTLLVYNKDQKQADYSSLQNKYRPSHADYTTEVKYGLRASSGGGRASARETIGRVAAASVAEQILADELPKLEVVAFVESMHHITVQDISVQSLTRKKIDAFELRCPEEKTHAAMKALLAKVKSAGDSVGGVIRCVIKNPPKGLGEPVFDKLQADLAKALMSLPATKGFEIGSGFLGSRMLGSEHNDEFYLDQGEIRTTTNHSGGVQGGISNGETIHMRLAFKPVSTIFKPQHTVSKDFEECTLHLKKGRHDPCVLPRAVVMVEAMTVLVIMDHFLRNKVVRMKVQ